MTRFTQDDLPPLASSSPQDVAGLLDLIGRLSSAYSVPAIMEIVTQAARTLIRADGITFVLREGDFSYYAEEHALTSLWKGKRFPMSDCISGWCMMQGKAAVIPDILVDPRIPHDVYRPTFVKSMAMVPVGEDKPVAAIGAYWSCVREILPGEVALLKTIANAAALAVAKVELEDARDRAEQAQLSLSQRYAEMISVIEMISRQTLRSTHNSEEFSRAFSDRLHAMARTQKLLNQRADYGVSLDLLMADHFSAHGPSGQIEWTGPDVLLQAGQALDLGLVLHELTSNAQKYGALSAAEGRLKLSWHLPPRGETPSVVLSWVESNGPRVVAPVLGGFGTALFRTSFRKEGGEVVVRYRPDGLVCEMRIMLR